MNKLLYTMAEDMNIPKYKYEEESDYKGRIVYSSLGQWCLKVASANKYGGSAISKHRQTGMINNLIMRYSELFPEIKDYFSNEKDSAVTIRRIYEETGYIITDEANYNSIAQYGRTIKIGKKYLYFGEPFRHEMNGLGLFSHESINDSDIKTFLIRDSLSCEDYINSCFDITDFDEFQDSEEDLLFFNPSLDVPVSASWCKRTDIKQKIARSDSIHQFYLLQTLDGKVYFKNYSLCEDASDFTGHEYRRLYFALKNQYKHPVKAWINKTDDNYSRIKLSSYLPNREYYLLLLLAWPIGNMFCRNEFLIKNEFTDFLLSVLEKIGVKGEQNG